MKTAIVFIVVMLSLTTICAAQPPDVNPLPDSGGPYIDDGISIHYDSNLPGPGPIIDNGPVNNGPINNGPVNNGPVNSGPVNNDNSGGNAPPYSSPPSYDPSPSGDTFATSLPEGEVTQQQVASSGAMSYMVIPYSLQHWIYYNGRWTTDAAGAYLGRRMSIVIYNPTNQNINVYEKYWNSGRVNYRNWGYHYGQTYIHAIFLADERGWHELAVKGSQSGWSNVIWVKVY